MNNFNHEICIKKKKEMQKKFQILLISLCLVLENALENSKRKLSEKSNKKGIVRKITNKIDLKLINYHSSN